MRDDELLSGWVPYQLVTDNRGKVNFRWLYFGNRRFTESFFEETLSKCLSLPQNEPGKFPITSADTLLRIAEQADSVSPTAFIYHISRCGSTLISQLLACDETNIVLSEVPLLDAVLRLQTTNDTPPIEHLYKAVMKLLTRRNNGNEQRVFVKSDSWHILYYAQLHSWYPEVPSFLMCRSPKEVGESQANAPAMHSVPGLLDPALFGLLAENVVHMSRDEYLDHVLASYFNAFLEILRGEDRAVLLNYHHGAKEMLETLFSTCDYRPVDNVLEEMNSRSGFHSKNPKQNFNGDVRQVKARGNFEQSQQLYDVLERTVPNKNNTAYDSR